MGEDSGTMPLRYFVAVAAAGSLTVAAEQDCTITTCVESTLSPGAVLRAPLESLSWSEQIDSGPRTMEQAECDHILKALKQTSWVIGGPKGAAERLGLKRTTL